MEFSIRLLTSEPMIMMGVLALIPVVLILALTRNVRRLIVGLVGFAAGYVALGTHLAYELAANARQRGACTDAGSMGPGAGGLLGALVAVTIFEVVRTLAKEPEASGSALP